MLGITIQDTKNFMKKLLKDSAFYDFELKHISIVSYVQMEIYSETSASWQSLQPTVLEFIKSGTTPKKMRVALSLNPDKIGNFVRANGLFLNIHFEENIQITTGISTSNFSVENMMTDKEEEKIWDEWILDFFQKNDININ